MSTTRELDHLAVPIISLPEGKTSWSMRVSNPGPLGFKSCALPMQKHVGIYGSLQQHFQYSVLQTFALLVAFSSQCCRGRSDFATRVCRRTAVVATTGMIAKLKVGHVSQTYTKNSRNLADQKG